jgi:4-amino-4-deoxy-L-arabinose transferase-like glycosyltransferase
MPSDTATADERRWLLALLLLAIAARVATLSAYPLMDNTEARYAEIARKMVETGDWVMPQFEYGVPFWSKPPLSIWLTSLSYVAFGVGEFSARLPSLLTCLIAAWLTYRLALERGGATFALRATLVLATSALFFISAGAVMTDPALLAGTTLSMAGFWNAVQRSDRGGKLWGYAFFVGLAISLLAKGPVGVVLTLAPVGLWTLWKGGVRTVWQRLPWVSGSVLTLVLAVPWYLLAEQRTPGFLDYFLVGEHWRRYTESGWKGDRFGTAHATPRGTIWPLAVAATLPWSLPWFVLLWRSRGATSSPGPAAVPRTSWRAYLWLWMLVPPVFFTFAGNILFTYVLPGLPAFALLVAEAWTSAGTGKRWDAALKLAALWLPVGVALAVVFGGPRLAPTYSHKALVATYMAARASDAQQLVYYNETPKSAAFYARGRVSLAASREELHRHFAERQGDFYALTQNQLAEFPEIRAQSTERGTFGKYTLVEDARPRVAPAR